MSKSGVAHCSTGVRGRLTYRRPVVIAGLGILLLGLVTYGSFGAGVAAGGAILSIEDEGQVAGVPFTIRGSGFGIGESVRVTVTHADGAAEAGMGHATWTVTAPNGTFAATWTINPFDVQSDRFLVRAEGAQSGSTAVAAFGRMAFIMTDLFDYEPGDSAGISGGGFRAGEEITLQVIHTRGDIDGGAGHDPWTVVADAQGRVTSSWYVDPDDSLGAEFLLHAMGTQSHLAATWAFMDAACPNPPPPDTVTPLAMSGVGCPTNLNSCTSRDVVTTVVAATPVDGDVCGSATDTVTLDFTVRFETTANQRYDLGFFIAKDGLSLPDQTAVACAGSAPQFGEGDGNADPADCDSDKFLNLDPIGHKVGNPDTCGDLQNSAGPVYITFRATVGCNRFDASHNLLISSCRVWEQNGNHDTACTSLAQAGAGSKCDCSDLSFAGLLDPCVTAFCDDGNSCTADSCDSSGGVAACSNEPMENGSVCDDATLCTDSDQCQLGVCTGTPVSCDDGNGCTNDLCDPATGCSHTNNADSCDDDFFCNGAGACSDGTCSSPGNPCAAGEVCDEVHNRCSACISDENCGAGAPVCKPETGVCVGCLEVSDCQDPSHPVCDTGTNTCVECLTAAECGNSNFCDGSEVCTAGVCSSPGDPCAAGEVCDEAHNRCSQCIADENCGAGAPACKPETGVCVGCVEVSDCQDPSHPVCDTGTNTCVECLTAAECGNSNFCDGSEVCTAGVCSSPGNPCAAGEVCDEAHNRCSACISDENCGAGAPVCKPETGVCVGCLEVSDCQDPSHPVCDTGTNTCVECLTAAECGNSNFCDGSEVCTAGVCSSPGDPCAAGEVCDEAHNRCSQCIADENCGAGAPACKPETGVCVGCVEVSDCQDPSHPVCDTGTNTCVECLTAAECGNSNFCDGSEVCTAGVCSSPGDPCAAGEVCDEVHNRCSQCIADENCGAGAPACKPETGVCVGCLEVSDCQDPSHPVCDTGTNTCVECLTAAECGNSNFCDGSEVCTAGVCSSPGDPCAAGEVCDEVHNRCSQCIADENCGAGAPVCKPETGVCVGCLEVSDCQDPSHPVCDTGTNTCVGCLTAAECNNGNACDGIEICSNNTCHAGTAPSCDDKNPCTEDSCQAVGGCTHTDAGDAHDGSCESVTDSALCPFPDDTFRLINLQNPTLNASGNLVQNDFVVNATNPGQAYYNVFHSGAPGSAFSLQIDIPWPFITQGDRPIQVHDATGPFGVTIGDGACFSPSAALDGYTITTAGGNLSNSGNAVILRGDYPAQNLASTTAVYVSGTVPSSGLVYVTVHLNYGLKNTTGWQQANDLTTLQGPDSNLDGTPDGFGSGVVYIKGGTPANLNGQDYTFSFSNGSNFTSTVFSFNVFKKNPGVNGLTTNAKGTARPGVTVQFWGPTGNLIGTTTSDVDGFYSFPYKHVGREATYTVKLPNFGYQSTVKLKANGYGLVIFDNVPNADGMDNSSTNWTKTRSLTNTSP